MSYFRDDFHAFASEEEDGRWFHFWMRGGYDHWDETGWGSAGGQGGRRDSGVAIPAGFVDRFVLMRLAEMLVDRTAVALLDRMAQEHVRGPGNVGEDCLRQNLACVRDALATLEAACEAPRQGGL